MNTKMAIQFLGEIVDTFKDISNHIGNYKGSDVDKKTLAIISLLQQGEKYRQMWEEFYDYYGVEDFEGSGHSVDDRMDKIKQKYFPEVENVAPINHG